MSELGGTDWLGFSQSCCTGIVISQQVVVEIVNVQSWLQL